jgi:hypothetical protein
MEKGDWGCCPGPFTIGNGLDWLPVMFGTALQFQKKITQIKKEYPDKPFIEVVDGVANNRLFLQPPVDEQILHLYTDEYLCKTQRLPIITALHHGSDQTEPVIY